MWRSSPQSPSSPSGSTRRAGGFKITGDLTMKGVTKEVVLDAEPLRPAIKDQRGAARTDHGHDEAEPAGLRHHLEPALDGGGVVVSDEVSVTIDIELISQPRGEVAPAAASGFGTRSCGANEPPHAGSETAPI